AEQTVRVGAVERLARDVIADRLHRIEPELGPGEVRELAAEARAAFEAAVASGVSDTRAVLALQSLADSGTLGGWDQAALNALGRIQLRRKRFELCEQHLLESVRRASPRADRKWTAEALLTLLDLYLEPDQSLFRSARQTADRLINEFGDVVLADGAVTDLAAERLERIPAGDGGARAEDGDHGVDGIQRFELTPQQAWRLVVPPTGTRTAPGPVPRLLDLRSERTEPLADRFLVLSSTDVLSAYRVSDGAHAWDAELQLLEPSPFGLGGGSTRRGSPAGALTGDTRRTVLLDGQTALINSAKGLHAVGAITGKRLWRPMVFQGNADFRKPALRDETTDVDAGRIACLVRPGKLSVLRVSDGQLLWQRDTGGEPIGAVRIRDGLVLTVDPIRERVAVYRVRDGEALCRLVFRQPRPDEVFIPICYTAGVICGPEGQTITAYDARSGERLWSLPLDAQPVGLFEASKGLLVASSLTGRHWLIQARTGALEFDGVVADSPVGAIYGDMESGLLILAGYEETVHGELWHVFGLDPEGGEVRWQRRLTGYVEPSYLSLADGVMPVIARRREAREGEGSLTKLPRYRTEILLIDKQTGETVGAGLVWEGAQAGERLRGKLAVWPGRLLVQSNAGITAYVTEPKNPETKEWSYE
ncbi:MAG: PQQ-binding-like beta-propeller repeat protein, partial [Planctomycetes bacterium]|nr:PQQ-binding-like beta-propeller repeat protein [Planctomycetota bacterium]